jgi:SAM-dependent methyltransferase
MAVNNWDERYAGEDYFFGTEPNAFLVEQRLLLKPGMSCLAVADGEGRNGVWLAQQGLRVLSVEASPVALEKARKLARQRGVTDGTTSHLTRLPNNASQVIGYVEFEQADLAQWQWGENRFDIVVAIFIQFAPPALRAQIFAGIKRCLKPGGLLLLQGYTPRQLEYKTGGPPVAENMYTEGLLRLSFGDMEIAHLRDHDDQVSEGAGHSGMSALIDMVARKVT